MNIVEVKCKNPLIITFISAFFLSTGMAQDRAFQLEEIWGSTKLYARMAAGFNAMPDGENYSNAEEKMGGTYILKYSFKTGKVIDTLIRPADLISNGDTVDFTDYSFSSDASKILMKVNSEKIYRISEKLISKITGIYKI